MPTDKVLDDFKKIFSSIIIFTLFAFVVIVADSFDKILPDSLGLNIATFLVAVLAFSTLLHQSKINYQIKQDEIKLNFRKEQMDKLYIPLSSYINGNVEIEFENIEKYSYLASNELKKYIYDFVACHKCPTKNDDKYASLKCNVLRALKDDMDNLKVAFDQYLEY